MMAGITECGIPSMSLSDNGIVYTGRFHAFESAFEVNLRALGMRTINSTPSHPQTCGKIERFWQTLKKWLRARHSRPPSMNSTPCSRSSAASTTTTDPTVRCVEPLRPKRSPPPQKPAQPTGHYPHRSSSATTPSARSRATYTSRPTESTSDCAGPATNATSSATVTTSRSSAVTTRPRLHRRPPPIPPTRRQKHPNLPHPRTQTSIMSVSDVPRHKCQRCPETPQHAQRDQHTEITRMRPR